MLILQNKKLVVFMNRIFKTEEFKTPEKAKELEE